MTEHDEQCERLTSFYLCHCAKRERLSRGITELPKLEVAYPTCGGCERETWHDGDSFRCDHCHVTWGSNASDGEQAESFCDDYDDGHATLDELRAKWLEGHLDAVPLRGASL